jgi:hypothetical protein
LARFNRRQANLSLSEWVVVGPVRDWD